MDINGLDRHKVARLNIEAYIKNEKISQAELARRSGIHPPHFNRFLRGGRGLGDKLEEQISNAMGLKSRYELYRPPKGLLDPMIEEIIDKMLKVNEKGVELEPLLALVDLLLKNPSTEITNHLTRQIHLLEKI